MSSIAGMLTIKLRKKPNVLETNFDQKYYLPQSSFEACNVIKFKQFYIGWEIPDFMFIR